MKCSRCAAEVPGQAQFCMRCGTPVSAARPGGAVTMARPISAPSAGASKKPLVAGIVGAIAVLAIAAFAGYRFLNPTNKTEAALNGGRVLDAAGTGLNGGPLADATGRIHNTGPLTDKNGLSQPPPVNPQDVIDYLAFLKEIEKERLLLTRHQIGELLAMSHKLTLAGVESAIENGEPERAARKDFGDFQTTLNKWQSDWQALSKKFLSRTPPVACQKLADNYYQVLGKCAGSIASVGNSFSKAMSGDARAALDSLTGQQGSGMGSPSREVGDACVAADGELARVCDKFRLTKDWSIQDDQGGQSMIGR